MNFLFDTQTGTHLAHNRNYDRTCCAAAAAFAVVVGFAAAVGAAAVHVGAAVAVGIFAAASAKRSAAADAGDCGGRRSRFPNTVVGATAAAVVVKVGAAVFNVGAAAAAAGLVGAGATVGEEVAAVKAVEVDEARRPPRGVLEWDFFLFFCLLFVCVIVLEEKHDKTLA